MAKKESFMTTTIKEIADIIDKTVGLLDEYKPPSNLTRHTYKNLTEMKIMDLVKEHGEDDVKRWIVENQVKDGTYGSR